MLWKLMLMLAVALAAIIPNAHSLGGGLGRCSTIHRGKVRERTAGERTAAYFDPARFSRHQGRRTAKVDADAIAYSSVPHLARLTTTPSRSMLVGPMGAANGGGGYGGGPEEDDPDAEPQKDNGPGIPNPLSWAVLRLKFTEPRYTSPLNYESRPGAYKCKGCGAALFDSSTKYESGSGWPAFVAPVDGGEVKLEDPKKDLFGRTEVLCSRCDGHLGHVFPDGPRKEVFAADGTVAEGTGRRFCINGAALRFEQRERKTDGQ